MTKDQFYTSRPIFKRKNSKKGSKAWNTLCLKIRFTWAGSYYLFLLLATKLERYTILHFKFDHFLSFRYAHKHKQWHPRFFPDSVQIQKLANLSFRSALYQIIALLWRIFAWSWRNFYFNYYWGTYPTVSCNSDFNQTWTLQRYLKRLQTSNI